MEANNKETQTGKIHAFDPRHWVARYADYLYNYAIARINDDELVRDLVQETFLAGLERADKFEGRSTESTWLTSILKNKIIDVYRKKSSGMLKRGDEQLEQFDQEGFFNSEDGHWNGKYRPREFGLENEDVLEKKEFNIILQMCMQKLPALWLSVFTMKHMDDETAEVICRELKITPSNFWVIIHRAKVNMRACLQKNWI